MYRDFRDVFISYAYFYTYNKNAGHWSRPRSEQRFFQTFFNQDRDRITYAITKMMETFNFEGYAQWLDCPNTLQLRFENVYAELASDSLTGFGDSLIRIFKYLGVDARQIDPILFKKRFIGNSMTATEITQKSERYKTLFSQEHYRLLDNDRFRDLMHRFKMRI